MSQRDDSALLEDMIRAGQAALRDVGNNDFAIISANPVRMLGLLKCIEIIGEASARLSAEMRDSHPEVPWVKIVGMRNRLVHAYFDVDDQQVWKVLTEDLPILVTLIKQILASRKSN